MCEVHVSNLELLKSIFVLTSIYGACISKIHQIKGATHYVAMSMSPTYWDEGGAITHRENKAEYL